MNEIELIKNWIENYIVSLDLCPFAKSVLDKNQIHYEVIDFESFKNSIVKILEHFASEENRNIKTTFIIFKEPKNYLDFLEYYYEAEEYILEEEKFEDIKLVGFHPEYEHGEVINKNLHYSNRSPLPLIQLLSNDYLEENTNSKLVEAILIKNERTLNDKGLKALQNIINDC